ncbi:MAG: hypothetical protein ABIK62_01705 [candidate division WOR-3 bacterium]
MRKLVLVLPTLLVALAWGNLLTNGDFEQPLDVGWQTEYSGVVTIDRDVGYHPDPDYEIRDSLYASGYGRLYQTVDVPGSRLILNFSAKFEIGGGSSTCWPVASIVVGYCDQLGAILGETRFYWHNSYCNWTPSSTLSLIEITDPDWNDYSLDIVNELAQNLPGVDPNAIKKVQVSAYTYTSGG